MNILAKSISYKLLALNIIIITILCFCVYFAGSYALEAQIGDGENSEIIIDGIMKIIEYILIIFGLLLIAINYFVVRKFVTVPITQATSLLKIIAKGDLSTDLHHEDGDEISELYNTFKKMQDNVSDIIHGIRLGANEVHTAAEQVSRGNTDLSQRTQEQASSLEQVASSMEEMTSTVNQNAENANQANQLARGARDQAEQGGEVAGQAVTAMNDINEASNKIANIISVIDEIAFQTNLLALNAAVEAARAGEQGRGFAVVANEVRNLAGRCKTAAKEIKELIQDSVHKVDDGTKLVDKSNQALNDIVLSVKKVSDIVSEIAMASQEQSDGIAQVNKALLQMDEMTQQNASLVEEAAAASEAMGAQAEELTASVENFKLSDEIEEYKATINKQSVHKIQHDNSDKNTRAKKPATALPVAQSVDDSDEENWQEF